MIPVMIVEDEFLVRMGLRSIIPWETYGFAVVADACSAEKGLELYEQHRPYLILTDIRMSPMDGLEMMGKIREKDPQVHFIVISAYSEFQYAQQAIRYGVDLYLDKAGFSGTDIVQTLEKIRTEYENNHPSTPEKWDRSRLPELLASLPGEGEKNNTAWFQTLGLSAGQCAIAACRPNRRRLLQPNIYSLAAIVSQQLAGDGLVSALFHYKGFVIGVVECIQPTLTKQSLDRACQTASIYLGARVYCEVSQPVESIAALRTNLREACQLCNSAVFDDNHRTGQHQIDLQDGAYDDTVTACCQEIALLLQRGDKQQSIHQVDQLLRSAPTYRMLEKALLSVVLLLEGLDCNADVMEMLFELLQTDDIDEICQRIAQWIDHLALDGVDSKARYIDPIIHYIRGQLDQDLSIKSLAARFNISPNYLGKLFYQRTGVYLSNYVNSQRIQQACELIRSTNYPISQIGCMVGIENPHYFSRLFKEKIGLSPQQYRNQLPVSKQ